MLTEEDILSKYNNQPISEIKNLNFWGKNLNNIDIIEQMPNLEVVSLSTNQITSLKPFAACSRLKELYLRKNNISDFDEVNYLTQCKELKILWLDQNPICDCDNYRQRIIQALPSLVRLDNSPVSNDDTHNQQQQQQINSDRPSTPKVKGNVQQTPVDKEIPNRNKLRTSQSSKRSQHGQQPSDQTIVNNILKNYDSSMTLTTTPVITPVETMIKVEKEALNNIAKDEQYIKNLNNIDDIKVYFSSPYNNNNNDYPVKVKAVNNNKGIENFNNYKPLSGKGPIGSISNNFSVNDSLNGISPKNVHVVNAILNLIEGMNLEELVHIRNHISRKLHGEK